MKEKQKKLQNPLWGGRFESGLTKLATKYTSSLDKDKRLYKEDIEGSKKYAQALKEAKIISNVDYKNISRGLNSVFKDIESGKFIWNEEFEDIHMNIEMALQKKIGSAAKKLHTGRSRNDQIATDIRLYLKGEINELLRLITLTQINIVQKAKKYSRNIMPGFTHLQIAQPITFGHHLMAWYEMLGRDFIRFTDTQNNMSSLPLGSGALSGNRYKLDRKELASRLKFKRISQNSIDAVSDRDFALEFLFCISVLQVHLSRFCEEIIIWSTSQFNYLELPEEFCTGSSIMPQKKNPDVAELIRGGASKSIGDLVGIMGLIKNQPLSYNRDMQRDKEFIFDSLDLCKSTLEIFSEMIKGLKANTKKMKEDCNLGQITATELSDYLVMRNVPFRKAHQIVGKIVSYSEQKGKQLFELPLGELRKFSKIIEKDVKSFLDPEAAVKNKTSEGGTAPNQVMKQIKRAEKKLKMRK